MEKFLIMLLSLILLIFISNCSAQLNIFEQDYIKVYKNLTLINERWLKKFSFPEATFILKRPPLSYHLKKQSTDVLSYAEDLKQEIQFSGFFQDLPQNYTKCSDDLTQILLNRNADWFLKMLDSDGKLASGLLRGGLVWPGHFQECLNVYAEIDEDGHGGFNGQYCISSWTMNLSDSYSNLPLTIGICIPDSCTGNYIKNVLNNVTQILERFPMLQNYSHILNLNDITCKERERSLDSSSIAVLVLLGIFPLLVIIGSLLSLWEKRNSSKYQRNISIRQSSNASQIAATSEISAENTQPIEHDTSIDKEITSSEKAILPQNIEAEILPAKKEPENLVSLLKKILLCFSAFENGEKIFSTHVPKGQLLSLHGIRFLSLSWVILGHTYISSIALIGNRLDVLKELDGFAFQVLLQSPFSVDSFFLLSGFLLGYIFLKEASKRNGKISWIYFYVHRFWRLTPAYMVITFFYMFVFKYMGSGPFWDDNQCDDSHGTWWWYLLYINNFIPIKQMCVGWSWYLANDMQFYIISPLFLYPLWRWPVLGFSIIVCLMFGSWVLTGLLSYYFNLVPMFYGATHVTDFAAYEKKMWDTFDLIYDKPYCRISPYLIGIILAYILYKTQDRKNFLTKWQQAIGWIIAAFCSLSVIYGLYHVEMSKMTAIFYNSLCRSSFTLGLAWIIFVCETGHGGIITKILSSKFWTPLSRLTYSAYLVHPILIHGYYQSMQTSIYFTELYVVTNFMGFLLMSYGIALVFSLTFESPLLNLEKLLIGKRKKETE